MHISGGKILGKKEQNLSPESLEKKSGEEIAVSFDGKYI
jgi:hypothetical protein